MPTESQTIATVMKPQISFEHVLSEISVNRENPCEILRELISNSYDAGATEIKVYPLVGTQKGLVYLDNGCGLDHQTEVNGITPYMAFFSIGRSTKNIGEGIGYKCQGSKLCFASSMVAIITRTAGSTTWQFKKVDNPSRNLRLDTNIAPEPSESPWAILRSLFPNPDSLTSKMLSNLSETFFQTFLKGTIIVIIEPQVEQFNEFYNPNCVSEFEKSYIYNYIRFSTKHGDVRGAKESQRFRLEQVQQLKKTPGFNPLVKLEVWCEDRLMSVPFGYPYLLPPDREDQIASPANAARMRDAQFFARYAKVISIYGINYSLVMAIDGNRRALNEYQSLGRRGDKKSGIRLADQRGVFVSAHGIKICPYNELFTNEVLSEYKEFGETDGIMHYAFFIDGPFNLVTNRNSLSNESIKTLKDHTFLDKIKDFLNSFKDASVVFRELCKRLSDESANESREAQIKYLQKNKAGIVGRQKFKIENIALLNETIFVSPKRGEEHWVCALYSTLNSFVTTENTYSPYWLRPITFSGIGIDSICLAPGSQSLLESDLKSLEYKYHFSNKDNFNHPLYITDYIVCWSSDHLNINDMVVDDFKCYGTVMHIHGFPSDTVFQISDIVSHSGDTYNHTVIVIVLNKLIKNTFKTRFIDPLPST